MIANISHCISTCITTILKQFFILLTVRLTLGRPRQEARLRRLSSISRMGPLLCAPLSLKLSLPILPC